MFAKIIFCIFLLINVSKAVKYLKWFKNVKKFIGIYNNMSEFGIHNFQDYIQESREIEIYNFQQDIIKIGSFTVNSNNYFNNKIY